MSVQIQIQVLVLDQRSPVLDLIFLQLLPLEQVHLRVVQADHAGHLLGLQAHRMVWNSRSWSMLHEGAFDAGFHSSGDEARYAETYRAHVSKMTLAR